MARAQQGRNKEAIETLRRALNLSPNADTVMVALGYVYLHAGLLEDAETILRRSLSVNPNVRVARLMLVRCLLFQGKLGAAEAELQRAVEPGADLPEVTSIRALLAYYSGRLDDAVALADKIHGMGRIEDRSIYAFAGVVHAARGNRDAVDPTIFKIQPGEIINPELAYWIAGLYALLGEEAKAVAWLRRALELGNENYPWLERDRNFDQIRSSLQFQRVADETRARWVSNQSLVKAKPPSGG
jgi:serine/threonine-protein kinase